MDFIPDECASLTGLFPLLESAIGAFGLAGLDRLLGLKTITCVQNIINLLDRSIFQVVLVKILNF